MSKKEISELVAKAKKSINNFDILPAILEKISKSVNVYKTECLSCKKPVFVLKKDANVMADCPHCGALFGNINNNYKHFGDKIKENAISGSNLMPKPITKQDVTNYLNALIEKNDPSVTPQDVCDWDTNGRLSKSLFERLNKEIGLLPPKESDVINKTQVSARDLQLANDLMKVRNDFDINKKASPKAQSFVSGEISHLVHDKGYPQKRAVAAALSVARKKGYKVGVAKDEKQEKTLEKGITIGVEVKNPDGTISKEEILIKSAKDLTKDLVLHILMDMLKNKEEPQLIHRNAIAKYEITGEIDESILKCVYNKLGLTTPEADLNKSPKDEIKKSDEVKPEESLWKNDKFLVGQEIGKTYSYTPFRKSLQESNALFIKSLYNPTPKTRGKAYVFKTADDVSEHLKANNMALISAYKNEVGEKENQKRFDDLVHFAKSRGIAHTLTKGLFKSGDKTNTEHSILLHDIKPEQAAVIAKDFDQKAFIYISKGKNHLIYTDNSQPEIRKGMEGFVINKSDADGWVEIPTANMGLVKVNLNLDWRNDG